MTSKELNEILNKTRRTKDISLSVEQIEELVKDLEVLEILKIILAPTYKEICGAPFMILKTKKGNVIYEANYDITGNELIKEWLDGKD